MTQTVPVDEAVKLVENPNTPSGEVPTWKALIRLVLFRPWFYLGMSLLRILIFAIAPQAIGLVMRTFFDVLTGNSHVALSIWGLAAIVMGVTLARCSGIFFDITLHFTFIFTIGSLLRKNLFEYILDRPAVQAIQSSSGEAISRFRDDANEVANFLSQIPFGVGLLVFSIIAVIVMVQVNPSITLFVFLPLVAVVVLANLMASNIEKYRQASRKATSEVTGFIGETFSAAQAIKIASAESRLMERFHSLNETRRKTTLKDRLFNEFFRSIFANAVNLGTSVLLLSAGQSMRAGTFTVGDFALFVYYLGFVTDFAGQIGTYWALYKQSGVSIQRMNKLLEGAPKGTLVEHTPVHMQGELPAIPFYPKRPEDRLETLQVSDLSYQYPSSGRGIEGINLTLKRGSFTVITGRIGSGKTTLLRALLGLLPKDRGEIYWNGQPVKDPAAFFVPPRSAYTAQVPLLFQESIKDNILMGLPEDQVDLPGALNRAVLETDLAEMEDGLVTLIGAKGVKVSGGQRQRIAAARMFVRDPELLVFDDLSSALDVETEHTLWERVFDQQSATCLVVSHRRPALRRADHIIVLKDGVVAAEGRLEDLLESCEEMQRLWRGDIGQAETPPGNSKPIE